LFKPPCSFPPFPSLFLPFLAVSFLLPEAAAVGGEGKGLVHSSAAKGGRKMASALGSRHCTAGTAAALRDAGAGPEQLELRL